MKGSITPVLPRGEPVRFEYNPPEFESAKEVNWAEIAIPGQDFPLQQFVRGGLRTVTLEVYFHADAYDEAWDVRESIGRIEALLEKTGETLAPPVCLFEWGPFQVPVLVGAATTRYTAFEPDGTPIEATVSLTLRAYQEAGAEIEFAPAAEAVRPAKRAPAYSGRDGSGSVLAPVEEGTLRDAERLAAGGQPTTHVVQAGESLESIASAAYGTPALWRALAVANRGLDHLRELREGVELLVPDPRFPVEILARVTAMPPEAIAALRQAQRVAYEGLSRSFRPRLGVWEP